MLYPAPAYVRVETNWVDVSQAVGAAVYRVDCLTGERVPLRPYVSFNGDFIDLSCGYAIFWDTEPQLDRCVYYCTQAIDAAGNVATTVPAALYEDNFNRNAVNTWDPASDGHTYQLVGGTVPGDYDVNGSRGTFTITTNNVAREAIVNSLSVANGVLYGFYQHPVVPTGAGHELDVRVRRVDSNNFCDMRIFLSTANQVQIAVRQVIAGVGSSVVFSSTITSNGSTLPTTDPMSYRIDYWGSVLQAKIWRSTDPEPAAYNAVTAVTFVSAGSVSYLGFTGAGSTNALPITLQFDNHQLTDPCADLVPIEACSDDLVVGSSGDFRLGDPVRPCNDVVLQFQGGVDPDCVPTQGLFFGNMSDESFGASTGNLLPTNASRPIVVSRARRDAEATLTVATRTFADRDALRALNAAGSPLLLRGPAQYGIKDRYMSVGDVTEHRPVADHKIQPRTVAMPHVTVDRPSGPSQGVCGTRIDDLCDIYPTWDALAAAGLSWADLLRGKASGDTPIPDVVERTWNDVNSTYANWTAVNSGNTNWNDLLDGA
jgi:hypothetical protein